MKTLTSAKFSFIWGNEILKPNRVIFFCPAIFFPVLQIFLSVRQLSCNSSEDFAKTDFLCKGPVKNPAQISAGKCEITSAGLPSNQKPRCSTALQGRCWSENMVLKPHYVPAIPGPRGAVVANDWCIMYISTWLFTFMLEMKNGQQGGVIVHS